MSYSTWLAQEAKARGFDGCTGVLDIDVECCWEHDFAYRTGRCAKAAYVGQDRRITRAQADRRLRECYFKRGHYLIGLVRWLGVRVLGGSAWKG